MRTILIATDFSEIARNAAEFAAAGAKQIKAKIILFNAFKLPLHASNTILSVENVEAIINKNKVALEKRAQELREKYQIEVSTESSLLDAEDEIERLIEAYQADMVVMGMAPKSLEQDLLGNTTTNVIQKLKFPVLAVPEGVIFTGVKRILYTCDIERGIQKKILDRVKDTARLSNAEVEVFNVQKVVSQLQQEKLDPVSILKDGMGGIQYFYKNVESNAIIDEIKKEIEAYQADLLIMTPNKYGFWSSMVHRSKTRMLAAGLSVPLLSIPL